MKTITFLIIVFFFFAISCKKSKHKKIHGYVFENNTSVYSRIEGATVILKYWNAKSKKGFYAYDSVYTDSDGNYSFSETKKIGWSYRISVRHSNHFTGFSDIDRALPPYVIPVDPFAYLRIRIKKKLYTTNTIKIQVANNSFYFNNINPFDTIINNVMLIRAGQNYNIAWSITDTGLPSGAQNPNNLNSNFKVETNDTLLYLIDYD